MRKEKQMDLLACMSLKEKIGQLVQISADVYEKETVLTGPVTELKLSKEQICLSGSLIGSIGAKKLKEIQKKHMEQHPHNIPLLFMGDIINGYKTIFPIPLAQSCTFQPELAKEAACIAAKESAVSGLHITFSPMADLVRDARWGRVMESAGEDTYLSCCFAEQMVKGYQGDDVSGKYKMASCVKHFAAYGLPTAGRDYNNVELSERTLREDYLPAYKSAVDAGCKLVMASFNTIGRIPSTANQHLLDNILRDEMSFQGVLISDWAAVEELIYHGVAKNRQEAAGMAFRAGIDIDMMSSSYALHLEESVKAGRIDEKAIDRSVLRVLALKNDLGLFENPYKDADEKEEKMFLLCNKHRLLARELAAKSFVLLKNDAVLPLKKKGESIAFMGPYVDSKWIYGAWSIYGEEKDCICLKEGIRNKLGNHEGIYFAQGAGLLDEGQAVADFARNMTGNLSDEEQREYLEEAVKLAEKCDKVVLAVGEHPAQSGEAASRAELSISDGQMELIKRIYDVNKNIIVILFNGRPLELREINDYAKAVLEVWFPGTEGGNAIADILFADSVPSGKLTMSFPYCVGQIPVFYNEFSTGRPAELIGSDRFGSKYLDIPNAPLYAFGYGLSYTEFTYSKIHLDKTRLGNGGTITAAVTIKNSGAYPGEETVQMYIRDVRASVARPVRELRDFQKVYLEPGESIEVKFEICEKMLRFYDINMQHKSEPGKFMVYIGGSSLTENKDEFLLE